MTFHLRYISYLLLLNIILLSNDRIFFDLDPIENNQILLNKYNTNILDTLSYQSIIFNQNHHLPYGTFIFDDANELSRIDTASVFTQFIHKKGDFRYRDLLISLTKKNDNNVNYQFIAQNKSYTPLNIGDLLGRSFLQNYLINIYKDSGLDYIGSTIVYHRESPNLPISFNFIGGDGSYNTRKSESIIWGFQAKKQVSKKLKIEFKNSNQISSLNNRINIYNEDISWDAFSNQYFTMWNIFKSDYYINNSISIKFNFTSLKQRQLYEYHSGNYLLETVSKIDVLESKFSMIDRVFGISINNIFFGINAKSISFNTRWDIFHPNYHDDLDQNYLYRTGEISGPYFLLYLVNKSKALIRPYILINFIKKKNFTFSYTHSYDNILPQLLLSYLPQVSSEWGTSPTYLNEIFQKQFDLENPMLYLIRNNISISKSNSYFDLKSSLGHVSTTYEDAIDRYSRYFYIDIDLEYHRSNFLGNFGYSSYLKDEASEEIFSMPRINNYFHYLISYQLPIKKKPYSLLFRTEGRWKRLKNGSFHLNTLPMIETNNINGSQIIHYMNISGGLKFDNFMISYHNITNNGHDFSLESPLSDIGSSFLLPQYSFFGSNLSIFHYLNISWTFID